MCVCFSVHILITSQVLYAHHILRVNSWVLWAFY